MSILVNSLPNDKTLDWSKLKAFADDKIDMTEKFKFVLKRVENIVGKRRKCWLPAFSPFSQNVFKAFFIRVVKSWDCVVKDNWNTAVATNFFRRLISQGR